MTAPMDNPQDLIERLKARTPFRAATWDDFRNPDGPEAAEIAWAYNGAEITWGDCAQAASLLAGEGQK